MQEFTVGELAERIRRPDEDVQVVIARLKNWTKEGLIKASGERNPGSGRHRLYSDDALVDALFLSFLTEAVGAPAVRSRAFARTYNRRWLATKRTAPGFAFVSVSADGKRAEFGTTKTQYLADALSKSEHDAHIVIDLAKFHRRLGIEGDMK
jgi:hypothetical protein